VARDERDETAGMMKIIIDGEDDMFTFCSDGLRITTCAELP
jgi:hypothetical protein